MYFKASLFIISICSLIFAGFTCYWYLEDYLSDTNSLNFSFFSIYKYDIVLISFGLALINFIVAFLRLPERRAIINKTKRFFNAAVFAISLLLLTILYRISIIIYENTDIDIDIQYRFFMYYSLIHSVIVMALPGLLLMVFFIRLYSLMQTDHRLFLEVGHTPTSTSSNSIPSHTSIPLQTSKGSYIIMGNIMKILGAITIIGAFIQGINAGNQLNELSSSLPMFKNESYFLWKVAAIWWIGGIVSGLVLIAIGQILDKLNVIITKMDSTKSINSSLTPKNGNFTVTTHQ